MTNGEIIIHDYKLINSGEEYYDIHIGDISYQQRKYESIRSPFSPQEKVILAFCEHMVGKS